MDFLVHLSGMNPYCSSAIRSLIFLLARD